MIEAWPSVGSAAIVIALRLPQPSKMRGFVHDCWLHSIETNHIQPERNTFLYPWGTINGTLSMALVFWAPSHPKSVHISRVSCSNQSCSGLSLVPLDTPKIVSEMQEAFQEESKEKLGIIRNYVEYCKMHIISVRYTYVKCISYLQCAFVVDMVHIAITTCGFRFILCLEIRLAPHDG